MFAAYKDDNYPMNPGKFQSLQYLDSIRPQEDLKFEKIENVIQDLKQELKEDEKKKLIEIQLRFINKLQ